MAFKIAPKLKLMKNETKINNSCPKKEDHTKSVAHTYTQHSYFLSFVYLILFDQLLFLREKENGSTRFSTMIIKSFCLVVFQKYVDIF